MTSFSGSKYHKQIRDIKGRLCYVCDTEKGEYVPAIIDHYCIVEALDIQRGPVEHAHKKLSFLGKRSKGDEIQDLKEARDAITAALRRMGEA